MTDDDTTSRMRWIRLRKRLDELTPVLVVGLLVVGALGGWLAYQTHANPGVETEEQTVATWNEQAELSHAAEVTTPNPLFEQGQTLSERPAYFTRISPWFQGGFAYTYDASETGTLDVTVNASLRIESVDDEGQPYWAMTESLNGTHAEDVSPGETVTLESDVNISAVVVEIEQIQDSLGSTLGTPEAELIFRTQVAGAVNDENVADSHQRAIVLDPDESSYSVEPDDDLEQSYESTQVVRSERDYGPLRSYGPFLLILLSVFGLGGLAVARHQGRIRPSAAERLALKHHRERQEFDDWISTGSIPSWERTGAEIELDSLEDLVDVAIDTNERVIEDRDSGDFFVDGGDRYYTYSPDSFGRRDRRDGLAIPDPSGTDEESPEVQELQAMQARGSESDGSVDTNGEQAPDPSDVRESGEDEDEPAETDTDD